MLKNLREEFIMDNDNSLKSSYGFTLVEKAYRPNMEDTEAIVASIIALYKNAFALNHIPQFTLINDSTSEDIHTDRDAKTLYISCTYVYWSQLAYQFCHELCHYLIPHEVIHSLRWFEESICESASLFFMYRLASYWKTHSLLKQPEYADKIFSYVDSTKNEFHSFNLSDLSDPDSPISHKFLEKDGEYHRMHNRYIANNLLLIFNSHEGLWQAVPHLCNIKDEKPLLEQLRIWKTLTPEISHEGIDNIIALFTPGSSN